MNLATRLGMRTAEERQQAREKNVAEIKRKIRNSDETITVLDHVVKCIDAGNVSGYRFTGSGLVWVAGKIIERIDWPDQDSSATADLLEACKQIIWKLSHDHNLPGYQGPARITRRDATVKMAVAAVAKAENQQAKESNMTEKYQGYENYATWNVALHIANERSSYHYWQDRATGIKNLIENGDCDQVKRRSWTPAQAARILLADEIKTEIYDTHPLTSSATMYNDILTHALGQVDWHEVADSVLAE